MPLYDEHSGHDPRRYLVVAEQIAIYSGVYTKGEVITDFQAGTARKRLLEQGCLVPMDYDLSTLGDPSDGKFNAL